MTAYWTRNGAIMGDFIRYILTGEHNLSLAMVADALKEIDPEYSILVDQAATNTGDVIYGSEVYGEIEVNRAAEQVFSEDIEDLRDQLIDFDDADKAKVVETLDQATGMIAFQLSETGHEHYRQIDPLWDWLFEHYPGLLQIDEEGYYAPSGQILEVE